MQGLQFSAPLEFFRQFAGDFAEAVCRIPEIEELRENVSVAPDTAVFDRHLENLPPMPGAEYIQSIRPDAQLVGRVYFHLVENTRSEDPFAFLATYSTGLGSGGKSRHVPFKHALETYKDSEDELYHLLATVYRAAEKSELVRESITTPKRGGY